MIKHLGAVIFSIVAGWFLFDPVNAILLFVVFLTFFSFKSLSFKYTLLFAFVLFVPDEILFYLSGGIPEYGFAWIRIHPIIFSIIIVSAAYILENGGLFHYYLITRRSFFNTVGLFSLFVLSSLPAIIFVKKGQGLSIYLENILAPFLLMLCVYLDVDNLVEKKRYNWLVMFFRWIIAFISISALFAIFEYFSKNNFVYGGILKELYWGRILESGDTYRVTSFLGHPLKNAYYYLFSFMASLSFISAPLWIFIAGLNFIAILLTGSRVGFIFSIIYLLIHLFKRNKTKISKKLIFLFSTLVLIIALSPFSKMLFKRFLQEDSSTKVRVETLISLPRLVLENFFLGKGISEQKNSARESSAYSFLENPWAMMIVDLGFVPTILYLGVIFRIFWLSRKRSHPVFVVNLFLFLFLSSFSSYFRSTLNLLFFFNLGILLVQLKESK